MPIYTVDSHILYHDRPSHEARGVGVASLPTLSISDAERRAYHNRRVSDARYPQRIFDTLWILVRSTPISGRTKARPYNYLTINTITRALAPNNRATVAEYLSTHNE